MKEGDNVAKNQTYCNLCVKSLSARRESILQHAATHMLCLYSQPRYVCRQCNYSAAHLANVRAHSVSHHKTKDRIYDDIIMVSLFLLHMQTDIEMISMDLFTFSLSLLVSPRAERNSNYQFIFCLFIVVRSQQGEL